MRTATRDCTRLHPQRTAARRGTQVHTGIEVPPPAAGVANEPPRARAVSVPPRTAAAARIVEEVKSAQQRLEHAEQKYFWPQVENNVVREPRFPSYGTVRPALGAVD
jgi:hypothetical protein